MQLILPTIKAGATGAAVANLQDALLLLIARNIFKTFDAPNQPTREQLQQLTTALQAERVQSRYDEATRQLINHFQIQQSLGDSLRGFAVEEKTAAMLNEWLKQLGALDTTRNYVVQGHVMDKSTGQPAANADVRAFDRDGVLFTPLGNTRSDSKGWYRIEFGEAAFNNTVAERGGPDLVVRVYNDKGEQIGQSKQVMSAGRLTELNVEINTTLCRVYGTVCDTNGKPVQHAIVKALDRDLRTAQLLGDTNTDAAGRYEIIYGREQSTRAEKDTADLEVHVFDDKGTLLVQSATVFNAPADIEISLLLPADARLSEWEQIGKTVIPLLEGQGSSGTMLPPWDLSSEDIDFIVRDTQVERDQLGVWVTAARTAREVALLPSTETTPGPATHHVPSGSPQTDAIEWIVLYGWYRDGQPQQFGDLIRRSTDDLMASTERAIAQMYIPAVDQSLIDRLRHALDARRIEEALRPAREGEAASLGDALLMIPDAHRLELDRPDGPGRRLVSLVVAGTQENGPPWPEIREIVGDDGLFGSVQRSLGLMTLTRGHVPLMRALQQSEVGAADASLADLVAKDSKDWIELAR